MNVLCLPLLPLLLIGDISFNCRGKQIRIINTHFVAELQSYIIYWLENVVALTLFLAFELTMLPFVYLCTFVNIFRSTYGFFMVIIEIFLWMFGGILIILYLIVKDVHCLFSIMVMINGPDAGQTDNETLREE